MKELGLNSAQLEAVTAPMGPVLILAGAGSGKTRALTMRIVYLIKKLRMKPQNILAVTFTNKAAGEMKERIFKLMGSRRQGTEISQAMPVMGTFHSIGARILRLEGRLVGLDSSFSIYDDQDQESLLKDILLRLRIDPTRYKPQMFAHIIDRAKNNLEEPSDIEVGDKSFARTARQVYSLYQEDLCKNNAVDFGDLLVLPVRIFQQHPNVLKKFQLLWQYILVDEYQDTNHAQYKFSQLLAAAHKNIFVVGDDAQAIYGFRGANLQNILDFEKDYPQAQIIRLEQNYRSTAPILAVAEKIIELSKHQHKKRLWTENEQGRLPVLFQAEDELAEAYFVAARIIEHQDGKSEEFQYVAEDDETILGRIMRTKSYSRILPKLKNRKGLNNIAVLYRTHAQSRVLEEVMIESSIPYQIVGGLKFYERKEIKDIISYLRLLLNPNDLVGLKRVINVPPRGIGPKAFELLKEALLKGSGSSPGTGEVSHRRWRDPAYIKLSNSSGGGRGRDKAIGGEELHPNVLSSLFQNKPQLQYFFEMLDNLSSINDSATLLDILRQVLKLSGYEVFLRDGTEEGESRWENIQELFNVAGSFSKLPWKEGLVQFLEEVALMTQADEVDLDSPRVTLMTLHQAKGLEFDTVFMVGLEEGLLPHSRSLLTVKEIAEEIRLAYVGVTRAKKLLYLVYAISRKQYGSRNISVRSRILNAIPEELLEIQR